MKKTMLSLLLLVAYTQAEQIDIEQAKKEATVVTYTVRVCRDQEYNHEQWDKIIDQVSRAIEKGNDANADDMVKAFVQSIEMIYQESGNNGIHGEMSIAMSDGSQECCGDNCKCITRGACPCTDEINCKQEK